MPTKGWEHRPNLRRQGAKLVTLKKLSKRRKPQESEKPQTEV